jgi:hypothetical protein
MNEFEDDSITSREKVVTYCFCKDKLFSKDFNTVKDFAFSDGVKPCYDWVGYFIKFYSISIGIIILIPVINALIIVLLMCNILTKIYRALKGIKLRVKRSLVIYGKYSPCNLSILYLSHQGAYPIAS